MKYTSNYIAWDLETTGLDPEKDRILEYGIIHMQNGKQVESFQQLVKTKVPKKITELTGITQKMSDDEGVDEREAVLRFVKFIEEANARGARWDITHNGVSFDYPFLVHTLARISGKPVREVMGSVAFQRDVIDTAMEYKMKKMNDLALAKKTKIFPELLSRREEESPWEFYTRIGNIIAPGVKFSIPVCLEELGITFPEEERVAHRALGDARACAAIYEHLKN